VKILLKDYRRLTIPTFIQSLRRHSFFSSSCKPACIPDGAGDRDAVYFASDISNTGEFTEYASYTKNRNCERVRQGE